MSDEIQEYMEIPYESGKKLYSLILHKQLGKGGFGEVWLAKDSKTKEKVVAKFERSDIEMPTLTLEYYWYRKLSPHDSIPQMYTFIPVPKTNLHCLVMQCLGKSLKNRLDDCNGRFTVKTTVQLAIKLLNAIEYVHSKGCIHRDIKPDNFMFGEKGSKSSESKIPIEKRLFIIDFGMMKSYKNEDGSHIKQESGQYILGTQRYMSINAHKQMTQSRRDDLQAIGYMLIEFINGDLPWSGIKSKDKKKQNLMILEVKETTSIGELIGDKPDIFGIYLKRVMSLKFEENPDYKSLKQIFANYGKEQGISFKAGGSFDWENQGQYRNTSGEVKSASKRRRS